MQRIIRCELRCSQCGGISTIQRRRGRVQPKGHIKDLWCYRCRARTAHEEGGKWPLWVHRLEEVEKAIAQF